MKKKIGTLRGKPIVEGDSNLVKKTEIDISTIGNASTDDEYVYFYFPEDTFIHNSNPQTPIIIGEQTEENQKLIELIMFLLECSSTFDTIRRNWSRKIRYKDTNIVIDEVFYIMDYLYIRCSKNLEFTQTTGNWNDKVSCFKGDYKKIISMLTSGQMQGNELDPYLISKEEWDKAVEETYKTYEEIIEL